MTCSACRFFIPQRTDSGRIKRAAGKCAWPMPHLSPLPMSIDSQRVNQALSHRTSVWPNDNDECPTFAPLLVTPS